MKDIRSDIARGWELGVYQLHFRVMKMIVVEVAKW